MERIIIDRDASVAIEEYLEYRRIVGEDDGGRLFVPEEYEEYKRKVLPARLRNRLYKQHQTDFEQVPEERPLALPCRVRGCRCASYLYVLQSGPQAARCRCKHSAQDHSEAPGHLCGKCSTCTGFHSPYTCGCGQPSSAHQTLVETREEREGRGRPVGRDVPYAAMGGLTGFSSLADGYLRLDPSGTGAHMPALGSRFEEACSVQTSVCVLCRRRGVSGAECVEDWRSREDRDMAFFERRYQERLKMEKAAKQKASSSKAKTI
ncbi:hypothetical protein COCON_G00124900 [Conger conger]|uniref:Protein FAM221A n=1 Tax=Conger conger TaxID=82655 RepID=A0A9Q1DCS5_CONCO|nr:hypothetical protein COCON_G00124900 [Conger conger]